MSSPPRMGALPPASAAAARCWSTARPGWPARHRSTRRRAATSPPWRASTRPSATGSPRPSPSPEPSSAGSAPRGSWSGWPPCSARRGSISPGAPPLPGWVPTSVAAPGTPRSSTPSTCWRRVRYPSRRRPVAWASEGSGTRRSIWPSVTAPYIDDLRPPGLLHAAVRLADHARADVLAIDTAPAEAVPGVVRVLTAADVPGDLKIGLIDHDWPVFIPVGGPHLVPGRRARRCGRRGRADRPGRRRADRGRVRRADPVRRRAGRHRQR